MKLTFKPYQLKLKHPFVLATGARNFTDSIIVSLQLNNVTGYGEASLPPYLKENIETVTAFLSKVESQKLDFNNFESNLAYLDGIASGNTAAKAAIDIALHDLKGKLLGLSITDLYGIPKKTVYSTYTIGISTPEELIIKLKEAAEFEIIKLKLDGKNDKAIVSQYLNNSTKPFCIDVNQGWKDQHQAMEITDWLTTRNVLFIEQPMPVDMLRETAWLKNKSKVPIIADEAVQRLADLKTIKDVFSGVNVKLMKSTGIYEAHQMMVEAKSLGLKVLMGCMAESSCAVTAAAHLAPLADWADLDGAHLIANDPFKDGLEVINGKILLPRKNGIGISLKNY